MVTIHLNLHTIVLVIVNQCRLILANITSKQIQFILIYTIQIKSLLFYFKILTKDRIKQVDYLSCLGIDSNYFLCLHTNYFHYQLIMFLKKYYSRCQAQKNYLVRNFIQFVNRHFILMFISYCLKKFGCQIHLQMKSSSDQFCSYFSFNLVQKYCDQTLPYCQQIWIKFSLNNFTSKLESLFLIHDFFLESYFFQICSNNYRLFLIES